MTPTLQLAPHFESPAYICIYRRHREWPHQNFTNKDIRVGQCLLFPGQVTHGHLVQPLVSGIKYSLTMWTKRFDHDA